MRSAMILNVQHQVRLPNLQAAVSCTTIQRATLPASMQDVPRGERRRIFGANELS